MSSNTNESREGNSSESESGGAANETTSEADPSPGSIANAAQRQPRAEESTGGAGEAAGQVLDSARDRLSSPAAKSQLKYVVGLFTLVGIGFGTTGFLIIDLIASNFLGDLGAGGQAILAFFSLPLLVVTLVIGPVIAVYTGLKANDELYREPRTAYLTNFVGNLTGYLVMVVVTILLINLAFGGGGGTAAQTGQGEVGGGAAQNTGGNTFDFSSLLVPLLGLSIPVGLVGLGSTYLHRGRN